MTIIEDTAELLLTEAVAVLDAPPARQYIAHEEPAWDCSQLTVSLLRIRPKVFGDPRQSRCAVVPVAGFRVALVDCVPVPDKKGNPPKVADLHSSSTALAGEAWRLWKGLTAAWKAGAFGDCQLVEFLPLEPFTSQGGLAGYRVDVEVTLSGNYEESGS